MLYRGQILTAGSLSETPEESDTTTASSHRETTILGLRVVLTVLGPKSCSATEWIHVAVTKLARGRDVQLQRWERGILSRDEEPPKYISIPRSCLMNTIWNIITSVRYELKTY